MPHPTVSVIIPSLHGDNQNLERLRDTVLEANFDRSKVEIISAIGVSPNGRARDRAVIETSSKYLISIDDDVSFPDPGDLKKLVVFLENRPDVGLAGPAQQIPPDLPGHVKEKALELPRMHHPVVDTFTETDMVTHACLAIKRDLFLDIGMEHPNLISGTDPDLRNRVRQEGFKVGIVPDTRCFHPPLTSLRQIIRKNFRGGRRSRAVRREFPDYHLNAQPDMTSTEESQDMSLISRSKRHFNALVEKIQNIETWGLSGQLSYQLGYLWELFSQKEWVDQLPYPDPPSPEHPNWDKFIDALRSEGEIKILHRGNELRTEK